MMGLYSKIPKSIGIKSVFVICLLSIIAVLYSCSQQRKDSSLLKIEMVLRAIENLYVDTINSHQLVEDAIVSLLQKLDPHSEYMNSEEVSEMNEFLQGDFDGIGIRFSMLADTLYVMQVIPNGPSAKAGIMNGDRIVEVNNVIIAGKGMKNMDIVKRLRGLKGTIVNVKIMRDHRLCPITFKIVRDKISICSLDAAYMLDMEIGYIKIDHFGANTYEEFKQALQELRRQGLKSLILDLQDNGGGYLQTAINITSEFLHRHTLIVYTEGSHQVRKKIYSTTEGSYLEGKVVILINESTASASEIVAGALQDWDRAVIVGRRSFGKGLVQRPIPLIDNSMITLTVARYYTPTGRSIQKPYEKGNKKLYEKDIIDRYNRGEMTTIDSSHFSNSFKYHTLVNKREVYGGGGIMPDYFVPMDTIKYLDINYLLLSSGLVNQFIMNFINNNRLFLLRKYQEFDTYKSQFHVSNDMLRELLDLFNNQNLEMIRLKNHYLLTDRYETKKNKIDKNKQRRIFAFINENNLKQFKRSSSFIKLQIKALIASHIFNINEYYRVINEENKTIKKAMDIVRDSKKYYKLLGQY